MTEWLDFEVCFLGGLVVIYWLSLLPENERVACRPFQPRLASAARLELKEVEHSW
jgi:hypothetical protein